MDKKFTAILLVLMIVVLSFQVFTLATNQQKRNDVYAICNQSRMSLQITEQQCGDIQDATHTEFLCNANNTSANTHCWVENK